MSSTSQHSNPLLREGTTQIQRLLDALIPENVKIHELTIDDWLHFVKDFSTQVNYYKLESKDVPNGDWEEFFVAKDQIKDFLSSAFEGDTEPHMALFLAFLHLLSHPQKSLNEIPKRHLDFYYKEVLRLQPKSFTADAVHLIFELAKNALSEQVRADTRLEANKDSLGKILNYHLNEDIIVNTAQVQEIKSIYDTDNVLKHHLSPNIPDEGSSEDQDSWSAFGADTWSDANVEILIASDILRLHEGERKITLKWSFDSPIEIEGKVFAQLTTEDGWTEPINIIDLGDVLTRWTFTLSPEIAAITPFNKEVHGLNLNRSKPTLKISFEKPTNYGKLKDILIDNLEIEVDVSGITQIEVNNELGQILPDKPFMPFGPRPHINAALKLQVPEFEGKHIKSFGVNMPWLNMPANFSQHYSAYEDAIAKQKADMANNAKFFVGHYPIYIIDTFYTLGEGVEPVEALPEAEDDMRQEFKLNVSSAYNGTSGAINMFNTGQPILNITTNNKVLNSSEIKIQLLSSFYHDLYNAIYVSTISKSVWSGVEAEDLPKEPYTPLLDGLSMNYIASASFKNVTPESADSIQLFHSTPFGTKEVQVEENFIYKVVNNRLYLGLSGTNVRDVVSLLFQVAEGTENPEESNFGPSEGIRWYTLTDEDKWEVLDDEYILYNDTNNFLRSGIVKISIPEYAGKKHYLLDDGLIWIQCELVKKPESVSRFVQIHTQAAQAVFRNQENNLDHLGKGLSPFSISQLAQRKSRIKGVLQQYTSFGGVSKESDRDFYRRISERLRHKDRALKIWDYEHLILQAFPQLFKVKCLNHTRVLANVVEDVVPGWVSIVVIPQIKDLASKYKLKPKVSQNTKDLVESYLSARKGLHVKLEVVNPIYEEIKFEFKVKFFKGLDYNFYLSKIHEDLGLFVAPWTNTSEVVEISFDRSLYSYELINFLENLEYVDYIEDFFMRHKPYGKQWEVKELIEPSNALAVLVPAEKHDILEAQAC